jgi:hypothetical protein
VNVLLLKPELIVTLAGTGSVAELLLRVTVVLLVAFLVSVTVQVVVWPVLSVPGAQLTDDNCAGETKLTTKVRDTAPAVAVIVADWSVVTANTFTVKVVDVAPAGTVTDAGTVALALLLERLTGNPAPPAAAVRVIVHVEVPGAFTLAGAHESELNAAVGWMIVIVPPVAEVGIEFAAAFAAMTPVRVTALLVLRVAAETVNVMAATVPFGSVVVFMPEIMHLVDPGPVGLQLRLFPAPVTPGSATPVTLVISVAE